MDTSNLIAIDGIEAVVLGGLRVRGTYTDRSDFNLGIYYHPSTPIDIGALTKLAAV